MCVCVLKNKEKKRRLEWEGRGFRNYGRINKGERHNLVRARERQTDRDTETETENKYKILTDTASRTRVIRAESDERARCDVEQMR